MAKPKITLYFDLHSPFAFLAFHTLRNDTRFKECEIKYVPVLLIGMIKLLKAHPPWDTPNRVRNIENDLRRSAPYAGLEWVPGWPRDYPLRNTAGAQRALVACSLLHPDKLEAMIAEMYEAFWVHHEAIQTPQISLPVIADAVGDELAREIARKSITQEVSDKLTANTDEVLADGAVGLPWMKVTNAEGKTESFWGFDHFGQILDFLDLPRNPKGPLL